jgi:hypothetical protein
MKVRGVGIRNYRSNGEDCVTIDLRKKINLLVGANNCGKSNVLHGLRLVSQKATPFPELQETEHHQRKAGLAVGFSFEMELESEDPAFPHLIGPFSIDWIRKGLEPVIDRSSLDLVGQPKLAQLMNTVTHRHFNISQPSGNDLRDELKLVLEKLLHDAYATFPEVEILPQFRQIVAGDSYSIEGQGIVKLLASWQHPEIGQDNNHQKFLKIQDLLRRLLELPTVGLEVSHKQDHIIVSNNGLRLPLGAYGTGINELIIIAIAVLSKENIIFCIEEPEIHLHPLLQKRLIDFLRKETTNRYVITTHSHAFITAQEDTSITHLWLENGVTKSRLVETTTHSLQVLHDLGVEASDLLQANSVLWVEGPSDRIYLNAWLRLVAPELREGIHYSIMFYGGRLLSHVTMERELAQDTGDLVKLLRINQHSAILIDSDKGSEADAINITKQRIRDECETSGVACWISAGREIENYIPASAIGKVYAEITGTPPTLTFGRFDRLEECLKRAVGKDWKGAWSYDHSKPDMARKIAACLSVETFPLDLGDQLKEVVAVIRHRKLQSQVRSTSPQSPEDTS